MSEWQPRKTAPIDGSRFMAWDEHHGLLTTMYYDGREFLTANEAWSGRFTHWMPRPKPPSRDT